MCSCSPPPPPSSAAHLPHSTDLTPGTSPFLPGSAPPCFQHSLISTGSPCISPLILQSLHPFRVFCQLLCLLNMPTAALLAVPVDTSISPSSSPLRPEHPSRERPPDSQLLQPRTWPMLGAYCIAWDGRHTVPVHPCPPGMPGDNRHKTPGDAT